jgi:chromosome segregation ATPase
MPAAVGKEPTLEEVRLARGKWIETQQIIAKERADWVQGKEHLLGRLELIKKEVATLEEGIKDSEAKVAESDRKHQQMVADNEKLKSSGQQLTDAATGMEQKLRVLWKALPEPLQTKVQPLFERMPADPANSRASFPERFQNVLAALSAVNGANNEITVTYESRKLAGGRLAEVKVLYAGLGQAWYMSANGEAGIGRPGPDGWKWEAADDLAGSMAKALEVLEGKQSPAFVPLPVRIQ